MFDDMSLDVFFFFKQKTAYEMRISDWSSDVCSSDLDATGGGSGGGVAVSLESVMVAPCSRGEGGPAAPTQPEDTSVPPVQGHRDAGAGRSGGECAARAAPGAVRCARLCERVAARPDIPSRPAPIRSASVRGRVCP